MIGAAGPQNNESLIKSALFAIVAEEPSAAKRAQLLVPTKSPAMKVGLQRGQSCKNQIARCVAFALTNTLQRPTEQTDGLVGLVALQSF